MCLLRPNERNNACLHEECKQLSAANKQGCLFSLAQAIRPDDPLTSSNILRSAQNPSRTLSQTSQLLRNHSLQNFANHPISHPAPADDASDSEEQFTLNKKKIKFEGKLLTSILAYFFKVIIIIFNLKTIPETTLNQTSSLLMLNQTPSKLHYQTQFLQDNKS